MKVLQKWGLPVLTGLVVLAALLLPEQISTLRDRQVLETIHTQPLAEEDLTIRDISLPEKMALLARAVQHPDLEVYSTTQALPEPGEPEWDQAEAVFFQSVESLSLCGVLPESFDRAGLEFWGGSRAVYVQSDGALSAGMLYLQGRTASQDDLWLVVDQETGLPVWIDCALRSVKEELPAAEELGQRFFEGLGVETLQRSETVWEVEGSGGLLYSAMTERDSGRICVEPFGFAEDLFGEETASPSDAPSAESW